MVPRTPKRDGVRALSDPHPDAEVVAAEEPEECHAHQPRTAARSRVYDERNSCGERDRSQDPKRARVSMKMCRANPPLYGPQHQMGEER